MQTVTTFLMFNGQAEEAMNFYTSLIENSYGAKCYQTFTPIKCHR